MKSKTNTRSGIRIAGMLICSIVLPASLEAQPRARWHFVAEAGRYEVHEGFSGFRDQPAGTLLAISAGLHWSAFGLQLTLGQALGDDSYTSLEPGIEIVVPRGLPIAVVGGVGAGFMWESSATLSLPYYAKLGLEARLTETVNLRALVRRGSHANTGDAGTFRGPHSITLGILWTR